MKKVAITLARKAVKYENIFTNGIHQNIYTLQSLLKKTGLYDVSLVYDYTKFYAENSEEAKNDIDLLQQEKHTFYEKYSEFDVNKVLHKADTLDENINALKDFDILIEIGFMYNSRDLTKVKKLNPNMKVAFIAYGNQYFDAVEKVLFPDRGLPSTYAEGRDALWLSPHFEPWLEWHKTLFKTDNGSIAPYVWSPYFFKKNLEENMSMTRENYSLSGKRNISVMEPNLGFVKNAILPITIIENLYRKNPDKFDQSYILNSKHLTQVKAAQDLFTRLDVVKDKKMSFEARYGVADFFNTYASVLLSHQDNCALNYVYLECLYLGIPFVHNSKFFKEVGFYYEGYDVSEGARQLTKALDSINDESPNGDKTEEYLWKYSPENPDNINGYIKLIEDVLTK